MYFFKLYLFIYIIKISIAFSHLDVYSNGLESYLDSLTSAALRQSSTCIRKALADLLPDCSILRDNESYLRVRYAIELSMCEFEASGVIYPEECRSSSNYVSCSRALASQPVWWTTFSNSYQAISTVCLEHQTGHQESELLKRYTEYFVAQLNFTRRLEKSFALLDRKNHQAIQISDDFDIFSQKFQEYSNSVWKSLINLENAAKDSNIEWKNAVRRRENEIQTLVSLHNAHYSKISQEIESTEKAHRAEINSIIQAVESTVESMLTSFYSKTRLLNQDLESLRIISNDTLNNMSQLNHRAMSLEQSYFPILDAIVNTSNTLLKFLVFLLAIMVISYKRSLYLPISVAYIYQGNYITGLLLVLSAKSCFSSQDNMLRFRKKIVPKESHQLAAECYFLDY